MMGEGDHPCSGLDGLHQCARLLQDLACWSSPAGDDHRDSPLAVAAGEPPRSIWYSRKNSQGEPGSTRTLAGVKRGRMERRTLGRTGFATTVLGFGAMEIRGGRCRSNVYWDGCSGSTPHVGLVVALFPTTGLAGQVRHEA